MTREIASALSAERVKDALDNRQTQLALVILALLALVGLRAPGFLAPSNLAAVLNDTSLLLMLALGQTLVLLTRGVDLSVAANVALTGMIVALLAQHYAWLPLPAIIVLSLAVGLALGAINGLLVWLVGIPPIVTTLGTMSVYRGLVFVISGGEWVSSDEMGATFLGFPRSDLLGMSATVWIAVIAAVLVGVLLNYTRLGRNIYAGGGNPAAASYVGIDLARLQFIAFCFSGMLAGLAGYLWVAKYAVAYVEVAQGFELQVVAACVIGGVSIAGGIGTVTGCVMGALLLGLIKNALPSLNISPFWHLGISGTVIVVAVIINARRERRRGRLILPEAHATQEETA